MYESSQQIQSVMTVQYVPRCPGRGKGECGRGSVGDVVVRIRLFLLLVRQLQTERKRDLFW